MISKEIHLRLEPNIYKTLLDLQTDFKKLNTTRQNDFIRRNGFNPCTFKDFFESSMMVCTTFGEIIGDLRWENSRLVINIDNLKKRQSLLTKEAVILPRNWNFKSWRMNVSGLYND